MSDTHHQDDPETALRHCQDALDHLRFALDQHAIVSIADASGLILHVNDLFCRISGYTREELLGSDHRVVKSSHHPADFYRDMWATINAGRVWHGKVCNARKDGSQYWVDSTIVPILDQNGLPYRYISIRTDVTELEAYRQEAELEQEMARELMDRMIQASATDLTCIKTWQMPATRFSGDLILANRSLNNHVYVMLADSMGHGLTAALPLQPVSQIFRTMTDRGFALATIAREMNSQLRRLMPVGRFVSVTLARIDRANNLLEIWNGGNPVALAVDDRGEVLRRFPSRHPSLGPLAPGEFNADTEIWQWHGPSHLLLLSDGLLEVEDADGQPLGEERLVQAIQNSPDIHGNLVAAVLRHIPEDRRGHDDISLVTVAL